MSENRGLDDLIIRGLSGEHLAWFLPGADNKAAISHAVSSKHAWSGPGIPRGAVTPDGIGEWATSFASRACRRANAIRFITWPEVLTVIELGGADGYRETYEIAYHAWSTANREAWKSYRPADPGRIPWVDQAAIQETKQALIRHGVSRMTIQDALF